MTHRDALSEWTTCVSSNLPPLSKAQATGRALWSFGIACTRTCGRLTGATFLALLTEDKVANLEQRLYEGCREACDKAGAKRAALRVEACFVPLLQWIVRLWSTTELARTIDASSLGDRFVVLAVCVGYRGCAIPVTWSILPAGRKGAWRKEWWRLLRLLWPALPREWTILVLADRGWYARWRFRRIVRLGWHPFLRINQGCKFRPANKAQFVWVRALVGQVGVRWRGRGTAFGSPECRLNCTWAAWWAEGHEEPWFGLTDLPPDGCDAPWYALRGWCEQSFKSGKRGGWHWQQPQMRAPARASRMWRALAVATLWLLTIGSAVELGPREEMPELPDLSAILGARGARRPRAIRVFRLGWLWLLVQLIKGQPLPVPRRLVPEPWPDVPERLDLSMTHHKALSYAFM